MEIKVTFRDAGLVRKLTSIQKILSDITPLYYLWGFETLKWIEMNFQRGGSPPWAPARKEGGRPLVGTRLQTGWHFEVTSQRLTVRLDYPGDPNVPGYVQRGTRRHIEKPDAKKAMAFRLYDPVEGPDEMILKKVLNPGMPPRRMTPTYQQMTEEMDLKGIADRWFKEEFQRQVSGS